MKKLLILSLTILFSCQEKSIEPANNPNLRALSSNESKITHGSNGVAFTLLQNLIKGKSENIFISPLSISVALAMVLNGADDSTRQSILKTIDYSALTAEEVNSGYKNLTELLLSMDRKVNFGMANSIWYHRQYNIYPDFAATVKENYDAMVSDLDFQDPASAGVINRWVEEKTNHRIKDLIDNISGDEVMFLINTIYFKGDWTYQFEKNRTHDADFSTDKGETVPVKMMFSKGVSLRYFSNDEFLLADIPYGNTQFNFTVLMPHQPDQLPELVKIINADNLNTWITASDSLSVELELPKFTMRWKKDLKETLSLMGMKMDGFAKLLEGESALHISRVIHQSFIEVNEEGSEAAAATAIGIEKTTTAPSKPSRITIDKPFLFMIREKHSGVILFIGQMTDPSAL